MNSLLWTTIYLMSVLQMYTKCANKLLQFMSRYNTHEQKDDYICRIPIYYDN